MCIRDRHEIAFEMLKDFRNVVADQFAAERTPEVFLLDDTFQVRYRGRIDDQYSPGISKSDPTQHDLRLASTSYLPANR